MTLMKTTVFLALLTLTPPLFAGEPAPNFAAPLVKEVTSIPADVAEQAALVQQIGEDAARGFDPEAHAHALRMQIEALVALSTAAKTAPSTNAPALSALATAQMPKAPSTPLPSPAVAAPSRDGAVRETIQKLRAVLDEFETQLNKNGSNR